MIGASAMDGMDPGDAFAVGWIGFGVPLEAVRGAALGIAGGMARALMEAWGIDALGCSVITAGEHRAPEVSLERGGRLDGEGLREVIEALEDEAIVTLATGGAPPGFAAMLERMPPELAAELVAEGIPEEDRGAIVIRHEPRGPTMLDRAFREGLGGAALQVVPVEIAWTIARPEEEGARRALSAAMEAAVLEAAREPRCIGAFAGASGAAWNGEGPTPFEVSAGVGEAAGHRSAAWMRSHARSPGWRAVIPAGAMARAGGAEELATVEAVAAGLLVSSAAVDAFSMGEEHRAAVERIVGPAVGDAGEAAAFVRERLQPARGR